MKGNKTQFNGIILMLVLCSFGLANSNFNSATKSETTNVTLATEKTDSLTSGGHKIFLEAVPKPVDGFESLRRKCTYPWAAKILKMEAEILIWVLVNVEGNVVETHIVKGADNTVFAQEVTAVVEATKWIPASREGKPVEVGMYIPFKFKI